jgi:hypothetical protein
VPFRCAGLFALALALGSTGAAQPALPPTLGAVLAGGNLGAESRGLDQALLDARVTSVGFDADDREAVVAFFAVDGPATPSSLHVLRLDRPSGRWQHLAVDSQDTLGNSVNGVTRTTGALLVDTHINPSAGQLIVLSRELRVQRMLDGWKLCVLHNGMVVYHHSQIHFAPTHVLELSLFDPSTVTTTRMYPPTPDQPVRSAFVRRVADAYRARGEDWFREHNHHMDPAQFDSALVGEVAPDAAAHSIAFLARYGDPQNGQDPIDFSEDVLTTCTPVDRPVDLRCRERRLADWRRALNMIDAPAADVVRRAAATPLAVP